MASWTKCSLFPSLHFYAEVLAIPNADDFIIFCTCELFLLIYSTYFTNVAIGKNATNDFINKMALITTWVMSLPHYCDINRACLTFLCKLTFAWIIDMPWPHAHCKFRDQWLVEIFLKSGVSSKKCSDSMFSNNIFNLLYFKPWFWHCADFSKFKCSFVLHVDLD